MGANHLPGGRLYHGLHTACRTCSPYSDAEPIRAPCWLRSSALASPAGFAARPFNTDDARIVDPAGYQIESFVKAQRGVKQIEYWFLPAHNFDGALDRAEFTLGGNLFRSDENGNSNQIIGQVKTRLKPLETNGIGFALTLGVTRFKPRTPGRPSSRRSTASPTPPRPAIPRPGWPTTPISTGSQASRSSTTRSCFTSTPARRATNVDNTTIGELGRRSRDPRHRPVVRDRGNLRPEPREARLPGRRALLGDSRAFPDRQHVRMAA